MTAVLRYKQLTRKTEEEKKKKASAKKVVSKKTPAKKPTKTDKELANTRLGKGPVKKPNELYTGSLAVNVAKKVMDKKQKKESKAAQVKRLAAVKRLKSKKK